MTEAFYLKLGNIYAIPSVHYTMECAAQVKLVLDLVKPDCVAVELPETLQELFLRAADRLPDISVIQSDELYYMCEPCDASFEALRHAREHQKEAYCIDLAVSDYPEHFEPLPDPYAIKQIGLKSYYEAYLKSVQQIKKGSLDLKRETHMARRLKELSLSYDTVLFVGGMFHINAILQESQKSQFECLTPVASKEVSLVTLTEESCREVMAECGYITSTYEKWRTESTSELLDRQKVIYHLYKQAAEAYKESTGNAFLSYHLRNTMKFARNFALIKAKLLPDLFQILTAAKGCVDHNYAYETWLLATHYPYLQNIDNLSQRSLSVEEVWGKPKQIRFHLKQNRRKGHSFQKRAKDRKNMQMKAPSPFLGICSYPPEDTIIENFGKFLKKKSNLILTEENGKVIPFSTSLEDGIDMRETIRHLYNHQLYVKVKGKPPGIAGSVVVIFDPEDVKQKFPWRASWHGEHNQESDMAFYATHLNHNIIGPGISRCEYGGFMMSYPPRRILDVWNDPDYADCLTKAEVLLMAAIDYAIEPVVVFVSEKPPRSKIKNFAARYGKKIVFIPIGQISPILLNKIRVFHVLEGQNKREIAGDYIF